MKTIFQIEFKMSDEFFATIKNLASNIEGLTKEVTPPRLHTVEQPITEETPIKSGSKKVKQKKKKKKKKGMTRDEILKNAIELITQGREEGATEKEIAKFLNDKGAPTLSGGLWKTGNIYQFRKTHMPDSFNENRYLNND